MRSTISKSLTTAFLTIALLGSAGPAFASAVHRAAAPQTAPNFVGYYQFHAKVGTMVAPACKVNIKANHTAVALCSGNVAKWSQSGANITIIYKNSQITQTFKGVKTTAGINTKAKPGNYSDNRGGKGTWYAVKTTK